MGPGTSTGKTATRKTTSFRRVGGGGGGGGEGGVDMRGVPARGPGLRGAGGGLAGPQASPRSVRAPRGGLRSSHFVRGPGLGKKWGWSIQWQTKSLFQTFAGQSTQEVGTQLS